MPTRLEILHAYKCPIESCSRLKVSEYRIVDLTWFDTKNLCIQQLFFFSTFGVNLIWIDDKIPFVFGHQFYLLTENASVNVIHLPQNPKEKLKYNFVPLSTVWTDLTTTRTRFSESSVTCCRLDPTIWTALNPVQTVCSKSRNRARNFKFFQIATFDFSFSFGK